MATKEEIRAKIREPGCDLVGFADVLRFSDAPEGIMMDACPYCECGILPF